MISLLQRPTIMETVQRWGAAKELNCREVGTTLLKYAYDMIIQLILLCPRKDSSGLRQALLLL